MMLHNTWLIALCAFILDLVLGDPQGMPHPVRLMGRTIELLESLLRKTKIPPGAGGLFLAITVVGITFGVSYFMVKIAYKISPYIGSIVSVILVYTALSVKSLYTESVKVFRDLSKDDVEKARQDLSMIVGRDTDRLNEEEIIRAAVETVAENTVDGIIAPLFYAFIGGAPFALAYKAINTLDSMVGYKNEKYHKFGFISARLDDLANYIPARIGGILISVASFIIGKDGIRAFITVIRDGDHHPSPNSGIPEAAVAGALGIRLGGINYYQGAASVKPFIGRPYKNISLHHIKEANVIMVVSSILMVIGGIIIAWLF